SVVKNKISFRPLPSPAGFDSLMAMPPARWNQPGLSWDMPGLRWNGEAPTPPSMAYPPWCMADHGRNVINHQPNRVRHAEIMMLHVKMVGRGVLTAPRPEPENPGERTRLACRQP